MPRCARHKLIVRQFILRREAPKDLRWHSEAHAITVTMVHCHCFAVLPEMPRCARHKLIVRQFILRREAPKDLRWHSEAHAITVTMVHCHCFAATGDASLRSA